MRKANKAGRGLSSPNHALDVGVNPNLLCSKPHLDRDFFLLIISILSQWGFIDADILFTSGTNTHADFVPLLHCLPPSQEDSSHCHGMWSVP